MMQLKMLRPDAPVNFRVLPDGYKYIRFQGTDAEINDWLSLCYEALIPDCGVHWFNDTILNYPDLVPENDLFFVVRESDGARVATSASVCHAAGEGYIHMVAAAPSCRGLGIGHAMLSHSLAELRSRGCTFVTLTTDDFRLAAIKTYLDAGFRPVLWEDSESDMRARWDSVIKALKYSPVGYLSE